MYLFIERKTMAVCFVFGILFVSAYCMNDQDKFSDPGVRDLIIREIMKKVSTVTLDSLSKIPEKQKQHVLDKIENKLKKSAKGLEDGHKYVQFIMDEFRNKAYAKPKQTQEENIQSEIIQRENILKNTKPKAKELKKQLKSQQSILRNNKKPIERKIFNTRSKQEIINDISNKIEGMAKIYLNKSQTLEEKKTILNKIQNRIVESSKRKHMQIHEEHSAIKTYSELISRGFEQAVKKLLTPNSRRMNSNNLNETGAENEVNADKVNIDLINQYKTFFIGVWNDSSLDPHCDDEVNTTCNRIRVLRELSCGDGKVLDLEQLCDGASDCWNAADETNCENQVLDKLYAAAELLVIIDKSIGNKCLQPRVKDEYLLDHSAILRDMLLVQVDLIQNYNFDSMSELEIGKHGMFYTSILKKVVKDNSKLVSMLAMTLDEALCFAHKKTNQLTRRFLHFDSNEFNIDGRDVGVKWSPKSCACRLQFCKQDNCPKHCKRVCWQKYSLARWVCPSLTGGTSVSLNLICDGKTDCSDESDEISCLTDTAVFKYEADELYKDLVQILSLKTLSTDEKKHRNDINAMIELVKKIQKLSTRPEIDLLTFKFIRSQYFRMLVDMYNGLVTSKIEELDKAYDFLHLLNGKMVHAMKRSNTGNENIMAPTKCDCKNGKCVRERCSSKCIIACTAEPVIVQYSCKDSKETLPLKGICNGEKQCPKGDDEDNCSTDACRGHHLVMLRRSIQGVGTTLKGTALGEVLQAWKSKVIRSVIVAEKDERPNHNDLREVVHRTLTDLLMAYSSMEPTKRLNSQHILQEFKNISDIVKKTLKFCRN